jgi:hypothetical protein
MRGVVLMLMLAMAGCATVAPVEIAGPDTAVLTALLAGDRVETPQLRRVRCDFIPEEGSEWVCHYDERARSGAWVGLSTLVARAGTGWVLIDRPCPADQALADRGLCSR